MGLFDSLMGNASELSAEAIQQEYADILIDGEHIECAFKVFRDKWVFTSKRLIIQDVQGVSGSKRDYHSIPYRSITHFSIETAGTFDSDCEMKIWMAGSATPYEKKFSRGTDIKGIQKMLAHHVLK